MTDARTRLYRELEYSPTETAAPRRGARRATTARLTQEESLSELTGKLRAQFKKNPTRTLDEFSRAVGEPVPDVQFLRMLAELEGADQNPRAYLDTTSARRAALARVCKPPPGLPADIDACRRRYELDDIRWITRTGKYILQRILGTFKTAEFRRHTAHPTRFDYRLKGPGDVPIGPDDRITIALFSDFGTGEYQSRYTAAEIAKDKPHYAIHLGDVYYVGEPQEFEEHMVRPLAEIRQASRFFTLNANHEMYSGGFAYFAFLDSNRALPAQEQEGSYFRLWSERYQIIGIDTAYDYRHNGELRDPAVHNWLRQRLAEGKSAQPTRTNILLSQNEPFGLGDEESAPLFQQIMPSATRDGRCMIDFWFWGDEHYCALFERTSRVPFVGGCIGNAGHPVSWKKLHERAERDRAGGSFARAAWIDESPRFKNFRQDELGNTGYCLMALGPDGITLTYKDWQGHMQHRRSLPFGTRGRVTDTSTRTRRARKTRGGKSR